MLISYRGKNGEPIIRISNNLNRASGAADSCFFYSFFDQWFGKTRRMLEKISAFQIDTKR